VGATTLDEYRKHIEKDPALERRFQPVYVAPPSVEDAIAILRGLKERYEVHHGVRITDDAVIAAAKLSDRYIGGRFLPDKAIDLIDEAGSRLRIEIDSLPQEIDDLDALLATLKAQRLAAIKARQVENGIDAMGFARFAPTRLYTTMARRAFSGELCSFFFAFTGEFLAGLERFLGAEIHNAFHVAPVPPSPGSCVAMSIRSGRLNVTHARQHGTFSEAEQNLFFDSLRADLGGGDPV